MSVYTIPHHIGDTVWWVRKHFTRWGSTGKYCPECEKYGSYQFITHDVFMNGKRHKCIRGILHVMQYTPSVDTFTVCSISIRPNKKGETVVYYIDENGTNHLASNTFATKSAAKSAMHTFYDN